MCSTRHIVRANRERLKVRHRNVISRMSGLRNDMSEWISNEKSIIDFFDFMSKQIIKVPLILDIV